MLFLNFLITKTLPFLPKWFAKPFANPYVAGETIEEAIDTVRMLNNKGFLATIDILGEHVRTKSEAGKITNDYCFIYDQILKNDLDCTISVKPTHLGLDISKAEDSDLNHMTNDEAFNHFLNTGMYESRIYKRDIEIVLPDYLNKYKDLFGLKFI